MYPCTCALMLALMNPSNVATRSSTRGTSRGVTVVTRTSGALAGAWAGLREQAVENDTQIRSAPRIESRFINLIITDCELKCRVQNGQDHFSSLPREYGSDINLFSA